MIASGAPVLNQAIYAWMRITEANMQKSSHLTKLSLHFQHAAATCGHLHLVKFLIDAGAELLSVNADGNMPYDLCEDDTTLSYIENEMARRGVTQELIDDTRSDTERHMYADLVSWQANGGDLEIRDPANATPLHIG